MHYDIRVLDKSDQALWDRFASQNIGIHSYHWAWNRAVAHFYKLKFVPLVLYHTDNSLGDLFPLLVDSRKRTLYSGEFGGVGGCLIPENINTFIQYIFEHYECSSLYMTSFHMLESFRGALTVLNHEMKTDLTAYRHFDDFFNQLPKSLKKNYRKAVRHGLKVEESSDIQKFYGFYQMAMTKNNAKEIMPIDWFVTLSGGLKNKCRLYIAYHEEKPVGSILCFVAKKEFYNYFTVTDLAYNSLQPGALLFMELYKLAFDLGAQWVNLGPAVEGSSHHRYKKKYNANLCPIYSIQIIRNPLSRFRKRFYYRTRDFIFSHPSIHKAIKQVIRT